MFSWNLKGRLYVVNQPLVMGILNITPDSFYAGSRNERPEDWLRAAEKMISEGVDILDIGGQSTRPGSERIPAEEELRRVIPVVEELHQMYPETILSIDTYHSKVALRSVAVGASIVNDISGGEMDPEMIPVVAGLGVPYICMHMQGKPETMQLNPVYEDVVLELLDYFIRKKAACKTAGIHDMIIDPGFGFGKSIEHSFELLKKLSVLKSLELPILAGLSRKSTIWKTLGIQPSDALNGTTVMNTIALLHGADILRVHDVKEAKEAITLVQAMKG